MLENEPTSEESYQPLHARLEVLIQDFGIRAVVDALVDIDDAQWQKRMAPAQHLIEPNGPFTVQFDKATDFLRDI